MLDNVIHDYGGLHGRLTETIKLFPFTLAECEKYYKKNGFHLSRYINVRELYNYRWNPLLSG